MKSAAAIILAGSHAWHADSLEALCPRALLPVANAPLISYTLEWLRAAQIAEVAICVNDASSCLQAYFQSGARRGLDVYYYEDRIPRGPAGAMRDAAEAVPAERYVVIDGSIIPDVELETLQAAHFENGAAMTVVGSVEPAGLDRSDVGSSPAGVYLVERRALDHVSAAGYQDIKESLIPRLHRNNEPVFAFLIGRSMPRVLGLPSYFAAQAWLLERLRDGELAFEGYQRSGDVFVHETATLTPRARVIGPAMIGPDSRIGDDAVIIGPSVLGPSCIVESRAVIEQSVLWDAVVVGARAIIDRALLANGVTVEAGRLIRGVACSIDTPAVSLAGAAGEPVPIPSRSTFFRG